MCVIRNPLVLIRAGIHIYEAIMDWKMLDLSFHECMKENWSGKQRTALKGGEEVFFSHISLKGEGRIVLFPIR